MLAGFVVDLRAELAVARQEAREARDQQAATGELLAIIGRSAFDLTPVFESIVRSAATLCRADDANLWRRDGHLFALEAFVGVQRNPIGTQFDGRGRFLGRVASSAEPVHVPDTSADDGESGQSIWGSRLGVPIVKAGLVLGIISLGRKERRAFTT